MNFKKVSASIMAIALLAGCGSSTGTTTTPEASTGADETASTKIDDLKIEFVPSKDADVIKTGTQGLDQLIIDEMAKHGYEIGKVDITVGTNYDATGEALASGAIDLGWLPGGTYALYSDECDTK